MLCDRIFLVYKVALYVLCAVYVRSVNKQMLIADTNLSTVRSEDGPTFIKEMSR